MHYYCVCECLFPEYQATTISPLLGCVDGSASAPLRQLIPGERVEYELKVEQPKQHKHSVGKGPSRGCVVAVRVTGPGGAFVQGSVPLTPEQEAEKSQKRLQRNAGRAPGRKRGVVPKTAFDDILLGRSTQVCTDATMQLAARMVASAALRRVCVIHVRLWVQKGFCW